MPKIVDIMQSITSQLKDSVGFSDKKSRVYLALLKLGEATIIDIANESNLKRSTVYNFIPELLQEGFIHTTSKKGRRLYYIEDTRLLKTRLEEKVRHIDSLLPQLSEMHNIQTIRPKITYFQGQGGLKELYEDVINGSQPGSTILTTLGPRNLHNNFPKSLTDFYVKSRIKRKIKIKIIATESNISQELKQTSNAQLREIKIVHDNDFMYQANMKIYANKVAMVSFTENFMGVIIESKEIHQMQKSIFELLWKHLP